MNLGEFHSMVSLDLRRGTSLDALIPGWTRAAVIEMERNKTLQYMNSFGAVVVNPALTSTPRYIELTGTRIKSIYQFRWVNDDGTYSDMRLGKPTDFSRLDVGLASHYWTDGVDRLVLSATPDQAYNAELWMARYTAWPTALTSEHWLLDVAFDVLEAKTMINAATHLRDPAMVEFWKGIFDSRLIGLYAADAEFEWSNSSASMGESGNN